MKNLILLFALPLMLINNENDDSYLIVGTYTGGKSEGIYVFKFNSKDGSSTEVSHTKTSNPSFVVVSPDKKYVYAVSEDGADGDGGEVSSFSFNKENGELSLINKQKTGGDHPCYIDIDKTGKWIFVANYSSGSLSVLPLQKDGSLGAATTHIQNTGSGPNKERQDKPHVHSTIISPDNKWLFVQDLGLDKVFVYSFDAKTGKIKPAATPFVMSGAAAGPRHIAFGANGKFVYLVTELTGSVEAFQFNKGTLNRIQRVSTLAAGAKGFAGSADIHVSPDGKFLYASNRGDFHNIAMYRIDQASGKLTTIGFQPVLGKNPRNFNFDPTGNFLLAGNQDSDEIVVFNRNAKTGLLSDSGKRIAVGKPVCLKFLK